jgi:hypothetical protein
MWNVVVHSACGGDDGVGGVAFFDEFEVRALYAAMMAGVQYVVADMAHLRDIRKICIRRIASECTNSRTQVCAKNEASVVEFARITCGRGF